MPSLRRPPGSALDVGDGDAANVVLPKVACSATASLPPQDIVVSFLNVEWIIPAMPASEWLRILWTDPFNVTTIFPDLANASDDVMDGVLDGLISFDEITDVALEVLEEASGYRWWFTLRLAAVLRETWPRLGGMMINGGARAENMSLGAWCTAAYSLCLEHQKPNDAYKFATTLNDPPPGVEEPQAQEADAEAFLAAMSAPY